MPTSGDLAPGNVGMIWGAVNRFSTSPSLEHLFHHLHILPILWPPRRFLRAYDVFESRGEEWVTVQVEPDGLPCQVRESGRPGRIEREIQPSRLGDQVPDIAAREQLRATVERQAFGNTS